MLLFLPRVLLAETSPAQDNDVLRRSYELVSLLTRTRRNLAAPSAALSATALD